mmetsp:Transcript_14300/g.19718  ORF Transcript_14300/g.19718 Transcript_14300/m.19718 type:complete len:419 (-) Transcript_14300:1394-2650(-)
MIVIAPLSTAGAFQIIHPRWQVWQCCATDKELGRYNSAGNTIRLELYCDRLAALGGQALLGGADREPRVVRDEGEVPGLVEHVPEGQVPGLAAGHGEGALGQRGRAHAHQLAGVGAALGRGHGERVPHLPQLLRLEHHAHAHLGALPARGRRRGHRLAHLEEQWLAHGAVEGQRLRVERAQDEGLLLAAAQRRLEAQRGHGRGRLGLQAQAVHVAPQRGALEPELGLLLGAARLQKRPVVHLEDALRGPGHLPHAPQVHEGVGAPPPALGREPHVHVPGQRVVHRHQLPRVAAHRRLQPQGLLRLRGRGREGELVHQVLPRALVREGGPHPSGALLVRVELERVVPGTVGVQVDRVRARDKGGQRVTLHNGQLHRELLRHVQPVLHLDVNWEALFGSRCVLLTPLWRGRCSHTLQVVQ